MNHKERRKKRVKVMRVQRAAAKVTRVVAALQSWRTGASHDDGDLWSATHTKTLAVDPVNGNDVTGDGSMNAPFATVQRAQQDMAPLRATSRGTTIYVTGKVTAPPALGSEWIFVPRGRGQ